MSEAKENNVKLSKQDEADAEKYLKELDDKKGELEHGPVMNRSCSDVICCLLFVVFIVGFIAASAYGWLYGDPQKLLIGWDSDGNGCGLNETTIDYPYLYWPEAPSSTIIEEVKNGNFDKVTDILATGVCVKTCPKETEVVDCKPTVKIGESERYNTADGKTGCQYNIDLAYLEELGIDLQEYKDLGIDTTAALFPFRYDTAQMGGFCIPEMGNALGLLKEIGNSLLESFYNDIAGESGVKAIGDIVLAWPVIAGSAVTALILGYLFLFVIRCIGGAIIYLFLVLLELALIVGGVYVYFYAQTFPPEDDYNSWLKWASYGIWVIAALFALCICCCWSAIKVAVAVYKTTAQYVGANLRVLLLPLLSWFFLALWAGIWLVCAAYVFSVGNPAPRDPPLQFTTEVKWSEQTRYIFWYQIFGLLWVAAFINGLCQFIIAASCCIWYFTYNSDTKGRGTVGTALWWGFRFHMGSIAFGSFIIAVVQTIRLIFEWYRRAIARASGDNKCVKVLLCLTGYCLWILEKCVKFISKNAYIQVALTNDWFCKAAWNAFALIIANAARFGWATNVGSILTYFGICCIATINGLAAFFFLTETDYYPVQSPTWPVVIVVFISLMIANTFLSIFGFSADAILQSFLLDEQLRFKGANRPEHMQEFAQSFKNKGVCC